MNIHMSMLEHVYCDLIERTVGYDSACESCIYDGCVNKLKKDSERNEKKSEQSSS